MTGWKGKEKMIDTEEQAVIFEKNMSTTTGIDAEADSSILIYPFNQYNISFKIDPD